VGGDQVRGPGVAISRRPAALRLGPLALATPAVAVLLVFFVAPLAAFAVYSFLTGTFYEVQGPATLDNYRDVVDSHLHRTLARNSLLVGLFAAVATVVFALPIAYWLRYTRSRWRMVVMFLIIASFLASYLVRIYAWRTILGSNGLINSGLEELGLIGDPLTLLLYNRFAVTVALVHIYLPYVVLVVYAGLGPLSPAYLETAQDLGAGRWQRWRRVVLPVAAAPVASAFLFVFVLSAADYVTPQFLGGTTGSLLGVIVQQNMTAQGDYALGAAIAFSMLAAFLVLYGVVALALRLKRLDRVRFVT
jgi:spermidine/putrescine transport system permease protein